MDSEALFNLAIEALSLRNFNYFHLIAPKTSPAVKERDQNLSKPA
jgi:hypothetical protein